MIPVTVCVCVCVGLCLYHLCGCNNNCLMKRRGALSDMFHSIKLKAENFCTVCSQLLRLAGVSSSGRRRAVDTARFWPVNSAVVPMRDLSVGEEGQYQG